MLNVIKLTESHLDLVEEFCKCAGLAGYTNNESIEKMKFNGEYDLKEIPNFWGVFKDNKLISVSGSHHWQGTGELAGVKYMMRCLFRSATLPGYEAIVPGISKNHMNSLPFSVMLPYQINKGLSNGVKHFYITTSNGMHDASGKMKRTHQVLQLLEKRNIVKYAGDEIFYSTPQTKWEIHVDNYLKALRSFHPVRVELDLGLDTEYYNIIKNGFNTAWEGFCTPLLAGLDT